MVATSNRNLSWDHNVTLGYILGAESITTERLDDIDISEPEFAL